MAGRGGHPAEGQPIEPRFSGVGNVRAIPYGLRGLGTACLMASSAIALMRAVAHEDWTALVMPAVLALCLLYQLSWIVSYLPLAPVQTQPATRSDQESSLRLLMANVLMTNRAAERFLAMVDRVELDVLIITEPNSWWAKQLRVLDEDFPYSTYYPLENAYGMMVYSRLPLLRYPLDHFFHSTAFQLRRMHVLDHFGRFFPPSRGATLRAGGRT